MSFPIPNFSIDLSGRTAIVTGASAGLGVRFAKTLAACGAQVALLARRADKLQAIVNEIREAGGQAMALSVDVADAQALKDAVQATEDAFGIVDILVNNAGIPDAQRAHKMSVELIDRVLDVNLRAPYILCGEVAARLIEEKKPGRIVNLSSAAAYSYDGMGAALYSTTKGAIVRMTEALSVEWAKYNINVNAIAPGGFHSEMMAGMLERVGESWYAEFPRKRLGDPAQLDSTLLYLVSPASEFVTGTCIRVDDGQHYK